MIIIETIYLHNLLKRLIRGDHVVSSEVAKAPQIVDKVYGDGDGSLDMDDVDDIAVNVATEVADKVSSIWDFITSLL